jgi:hypothetical protein
MRCFTIQYLSNAHWSCGVLQPSPNPCLNKILPIDKYIMLNQRGIAATVPQPTVTISWHYLTRSTSLKYSAKDNWHSPML